MTALLEHANGLLESYHAPGHLVATRRRRGIYLNVPFLTSTTPVSEATFTVVVDGETFSVPASVGGAKASVTGVDVALRYWTNLTERAEAPTAKQELYLNLFVVTRGHQARKSGRVHSTVTISVDCDATYWGPVEHSSALDVIGSRDPLDSYQFLYEANTDFASFFTAPAYAPTTDGAAFGKITLSVAAGRGGVTISDIQST